MAWFEKNGGRIYYEESGSGTPVLLMPGWGGSIAEFQPLREALAHSYRVIAADLPGSGKSGPQPRTYTPSYYSEDIPAFRAMLAEVAGAPAHVVGFSDGGEYGFLLALEQAESVRSILTWGSAGSLGTNPQMAAPMIHMIDNPIPPMRDFSEHMKAMYGEANARIMTTTFGHTIKEMIESGGDISRSRAAAIACPALLITGEHDFLAPPPLVADMADSIPGGTFIVAQGASHPVHLEQPEWLAEIVVSWLSKH